MQKLTSLLFFSIFIISITNFWALNAQSDIIKSYENYTEVPREVAYVHLNKSTYIEGEMLGFTAYVFDKFTKATSKQTTNLYCIISDDEGKILKKKLVKVKEGVATNVFDVDSTLTTGIFTFKAYTNWMRNFEERNHFEQTFKVIDADNKSEIKPISASDKKVDLQALGEGGHIVYGIPNTVGIIAKNQFGFGVADAFGQIVDNDGNIISDFQLNDVGLTKILFTPEQNKSYKVNLNFNGKIVSSPITDIKQSGINLTLNYTKNTVRLLLQANKDLVSYLQGEEFKVALHNGNNIVLAPFEFNGNGKAILSFPTTDLFKGINIFTIFDKDNTPLLERLYFNNQDILRLNISKTSVKALEDSLAITLKSGKNLNITSSNLSVSILPSDTKSYNHHNSILSQVYIQPYINGYLENGSSYFKSNDRKTNYNLDILMLTQGWSSYKWNSIFDKNERKYVFPFERGIDIVANINGDKSGSYIVYPLEESTTQFFEVPKSESAFNVKTVFPNENDLFRVGYVNNKKKNFKEKPSLYLQFFPSKFPNFSSSLNVIEEIYLSTDLSVNPYQQNNAWSNSTKTTELDEVVINAQKKKTRLEQLQKKAINSRVDLISDNIKLRNLRLDLYLQRLGWVTQFDYFSGTLSITNPRVNWGDPVPLVYLDNALLTTAGSRSDFGILTFLNMGDIDYIEYEFYGTGGGMRGNAGYIKVFSDPKRTNARRTNMVSTYDVPLRFSAQKQFYSPTYSSYNSEFFKEYGTIDWQPNLSFDVDGNINFKFYNTSTQNISLFIEGIVNDSEIISQEIKIERNN